MSRREGLSAPQLVGVRRAAGVSVATAGFIAAASLVALGGCSGDSTSPPALAVRPTEIQLAVGDTASVLQVSNTGQGRLTWTLEDDAPWLGADPAAGATDGRESVTLRVLADSLPRGPHIATVTITSNGGDASVRVRMWESLAVAPDTLRIAGGETAGQVRLANLGGLALPWSAGAQAAWLQVSPAQGSLGEAPETLIVAVDAAALSPGAYAGNVWVDGGAFGSDTVLVLLDWPQTATVSGRVYFQDTRIPAPGVPVSSGQIADTTDAEGDYALLGVPLGVRTLVAGGEGFSATQVTITVPAEGLTRELWVASDAHTYRITGRLSNARATGLVNATVTLLNPDGAASSVTTRTRAGGEYTLERVPGGARRVRYTALHYQDLSADVEVPGTDVVHDAQVVAALQGPPEPQAGPNVARLDCGRVRVSWTPGLLERLDTVAGYRVERAQAAQGPFLDASGLVEGSATSYFDDTDWGAQKVYYRVLTETIDGDPGPPSGATAFTLAPWVQLHPGTPSDDAPEERWGHAAVYDPNDGAPRMLLIGGTGCESGTCGIDFGDVWALDLTALRWELLDPGTGPADRNEHSAILDESHRRLVVFGGKLSEGERIYGDTWAFELESRQWVLLHGGQGGNPDAAPQGRFGHTAVLDAAGDQMIVYGGRAQSALNDVWSFDLSGLQWTRLRTGAYGELDPQPYGRFDHVAAFDPVARRMIIQGGLGDLISLTMSDAWAFDLGTATWTRLPDGPERCRHMMDYDPITRRAVFFGGWRFGSGGQGSGRFNDIWTLDLSTDQWRELNGGDEASRPEKRDRHSMVLKSDDGALYIFGGLLELSGLGADTWTFCAGER